VLISIVDIAISPFGFEVFLTLYDFFIKYIDLFVNIVFEIFLIYFLSECIDIETNMIYNVNNEIILGGCTLNITNKIRALLKIHGKKNKELADFLGLTTPQALTNKFNRGSFSAEDLIKIADFLGCELAFILSDAQKITLDVSDIRQDANKPLPAKEAAERGGNYAKQG
jgi:transcriptional regulator with XRE-family HTH domain